MGPLFLSLLFPRLISASSLPAQPEKEERTNFPSVSVGGRWKEPEKHFLGPFFPVRIAVQLQWRKQRVEEKPQEG